MTLNHSFITQSCFPKEPQATPTEFTNSPISLRAQLGKEGKGTGDSEQTSPSCYPPASCPHPHPMTTTLSQQPALHLRRVLTWSRRFLPLQVSFYKETNVLIFLVFPAPLALGRGRDHVFPQSVWFSSLPWPVPASF